MRVLIAGVGNIFMGDDGCGSIVAEALKGCVSGAEVIDIGTGGLPLTDYLENFDVVILVDAAVIDEDVKVIEVTDDMNPDSVGEGVLSLLFGGSHGLGVMDLLNFLKIRERKPKVLIVGCRPISVEVRMGLSEGMTANCLKALDEIARLGSKFNVEIDLEKARTKLLGLKG